MSHMDPVRACQPEDVIKATLGRSNLNSLSKTTKGSETTVKVGGERAIGGKIAQILTRTMCTFREFKEE